MDQVDDHIILRLYDTFLIFDIIRFWSLLSNYGQFLGALKQIIFSQVNNKF